MLSVDAPAAPKWGTFPPGYDHKQPASVGFTLPASWFTADPVYELERRAVFGRSWLYHSSALRYAADGDEVVDTIAGFTFRVSKKGDGFSAVLLSDGTPGFAARETKVHVLARAFVFVCPALEGKSFDEEHAGLTEYMASFPFEPKDYMVAYQAAIPGKFNWKVFTDNFSECYHCPTGHPGFSRVYDIPTYDITNGNGYSIHNVSYRDQNAGKQPAFKAELPDRIPADILELYERIYKVPHAFMETLPSKAEKQGAEFATDAPGIFVYVQPNVGLNVVGNVITTLRWTPVTANETVLHAEVFVAKHTTKEEFDEFIKFFYEVDIEDFFLASFTHRNLQAGVYSQGCLHPKKENSLIYYQNSVRTKLIEHAKKEKEAGGPIKAW
ncbi:hypothetical protein DFJ74DRAFT_686543 [Hyaloraphidium curvatum]|nr:hypothetical protein DFJ74DRAFT_686543 [Hyaloraphidium curvatum]